MEFSKIEILIEKYFEGQTSIVEENQLKDYFSSPNVAQHLEQYKSLFGYFNKAKEQELKQEIHLQTNKRTVTWLSIAASIVVLLGVGVYTYFNTNSSNLDLGTYDTPEEAFVATQQALNLLSNNVNVGIKSVEYVQEYENSKQLIFKQ